MIVEKTTFFIPDVYLLEPKVHRDARGFFIELYRESIYRALGIDERFVQDNLSQSTRGTLRGLHYQLEPKAQGKLVTCLQGKIFDVAVDLRKGSATFGKHIAVILSGEKPQWLWIPRGFAHGFLCLSPSCTVLYKTTAEYDPSLDRGIRFDDPTLAIKWPAIEPLILSPRDRTLPYLDRSSRDRL